jgi:2-oxoglutarate ferredoxin oxidoreductase subunit gamma
MNIRFAGFGGQGIVMAGYVLGRAGVLDGANALQTQSYGSESRGGDCKSDVVISADQILDLAPAELDVLVAMAQPALDTHLAHLKTDGLLIYDSELVTPPDDGRRSFGVPAMRVAETLFGRDVVANAIILGCLAGLSGVVSPDSLRKAISESVPPKTVDMNLKAFEEGLKRAAGQEGRTANARL